MKMEGAVDNYNRGGRISEESVKIRQKQGRKGEIKGNAEESRAVSENINNDAAVDNEGDERSTITKILEYDIEKRNVAAGFTNEWNEDCVEMVRVKKKKKKKKKKEKEKTNNDEGVGGKNYNSVDEGMSEGSDENRAKAKKRKRKEETKRNSAVEIEDNAQTNINIMQENDAGKENVVPRLTGKRNEDGVERVGTKKKKKREKETEKKNNDCVPGSVDIGIDSLGGTEDSGNRSARRKNKRNQKGEIMKEAELVQGKRFSNEEDEIIKEAVYKYIEKHDLGEDGLNTVLKSSRKLKGCWNEIAAAIPYIPYRSVYYRAQKVFLSSGRKWSEEEYASLREFQEKHGNQWSMLAESLGRFRVHINNAWLRIKLPNQKKGRWSQEEHQALFDLVNADLQMRVHEEEQKKKSNHGMLRDNICWKGISEKLGTRNNKNCCMKWYHQLSSPMVAEGEWADSDDYRLVGALYDLDASCMENVDWDSLLGHRSGDVCLHRWKQMVRHIGRHDSKSFGEQVEILAQRYRPHLLEARVAWDNKPYVS